MGVWGGSDMAETTDYIDLTPAPEGYFEMLWAIANRSEKASDRAWAKHQIKAADLRTHKKEAGVE